MKDYKVCVYAITKNEEKFVSRWVNSMKEADEIYVLDTGSTDDTVKKLKELDKVKVFVPTNINNIFGIVSIAVEGYSSEDIGKILDDEFDICVRTGYHCAPLIHDFIDSLMYNGTVRISLSYFNNIEDIDVLINALKTL